MNTADRTPYNYDLYGGAANRVLGDATFPARISREYGYIHVPQLPATFVLTNIPATQPNTLLMNVDWDWGSDARVSVTPKGIIHWKHSFGGPPYTDGPAETQDFDPPLPLHEAYTYTFVITRTGLNRVDVNVTTSIGTTHSVFILSGADLANDDGTFSGATVGCRGKVAFENSSPGEGSLTEYRQPENIRVLGITV